MTRASGCLALELKVYRVRSSQGIVFLGQGIGFIGFRAWDLGFRV